MKFRRLRDRMSWAFGLLLAVLVATTTWVVGYISYRSYTESLISRLDKAPEQFQRSMRPQRLLFEHQGNQFLLDADLRQFLREEHDFRDQPDRREDYEATYLTLADEIHTRLMDESRDSAELLILLELRPRRTVMSLRRPWVDPDPGQPPAELPDLPGLKNAETSLEPLDEYLIDQGELYALTIVPLSTSIVNQGGDRTRGLVILGSRMSRLPPVDGFALVLAGPNGPLSGRDETGCPYTPEQLAQFHPGPEVHWLGRDFLVKSAPLSQTGTVYFLADLRLARNGVMLLTLLVLALGVAALIAGRYLSVHIAGAVTRPLERLASLMQEVGKGDLTARAPVEGEDEVAQLSAAFNQMATGLQEREAFRKLAPEGARREIERDSSITLGGDWVEATILFSDLRGFTSMSEKLAPTAVVALLNEYLQDMSIALKEHGGDINEYIGDAILAVFHGPDSAESAVQAALAMQSRLDRLRERTSNETLKAIKMGIGIHTGELVEGWIGASDRVKYGVVGDTVNLAARIQDRSRDGKHTFILVSGATRDKLGDRFEVAFFGDETFKGKTGTTPVWEIVR